MSLTHVGARSFQTNLQRFWQPGSFPRVPALPLRKPVRTRTAPSTSAPSCYLTSKIVSEVVRTTFTLTFALGGQDGAAAVTTLAQSQALVWYGFVCTLFASAGASAVHAINTALRSVAASTTRAAPDVKGTVDLHGVDIPVSSRLLQPEVRSAVEFALKVHRGQIRKTGEPYLCHCIETAAIVEQLLSPGESEERKLQAIIAALLHDVIDDTPYTEEDVEKQFGGAVANMVDKVTQISRMTQMMRRSNRFGSSEVLDSSMDELRDLVLNMVDDPLALVIKLADRLHNMRTVYALKPDRRIALANETLFVWCAIAERLGLFSVKMELEDLCFAILNPNAYRKIRSELDQLWGIAPAATPAEESKVSSEDDLIFDMDMCDMDLDSESRNVRQDASGSGRFANEFLTPEQQQVKELLSTVYPFDELMFSSDTLASYSRSNSGLNALRDCARALYKELMFNSLATGMEVSVQARLKSLYSIHKKMQRKNISLEEVYDARALRIIVDDHDKQSLSAAIGACYRLQPVVHRLWKPIHAEGDDYIANPKRSGYRSLHTAVVGPGDVPFEVQIRTSSMHHDAEYGMAAHWHYKEVSSSPSSSPCSASPKQKQRIVKVGMPLWRICDNGVRDGVVVQTEAGGRSLLVAVETSGQQLADANWSPLEKYRQIHQYAEDNGWFLPGHGDLCITLERYKMCRDGKYHREDHCGFKLATTVVPLFSLLERAEEDAAAAAAPEPKGAELVPLKTSLLGSPVQSSPPQSSPEHEIHRAQVNALRQALEAKFGLDDAPRPPLVVTTSPTVLVMVWPTGRVRKVERGTTAGHIIKTQGEITIDIDGKARRRAGLVNVNNRLVPENTPLQTGDYVVLSRDLLEL